MLVADQWIEAIQCTSDNSIISRFPSWIMGLFWQDLFHSRSTTHAPRRTLTDYPWSGGDSNSGRLGFFSESRSCWLFWRSAMKWAWCPYHHLHATRNTWTVEAHVGESWLLACLVTPGMPTWMQCGSPKFHEIACRSLSCRQKAVETTSWVSVQMLMFVL